MIGRTTWEWNLGVLLCALGALGATVPQSVITVASTDQGASPSLTMNL